MFRLGIVIVAYNSADHLMTCLQAVRRMCNPGDRVVVIDNASPTPVASAEWEHSSVQFIRNERNLGFAGAVNQGFELLKEAVDAILLLNPDVELTMPLDSLTEACMRTGIAGGCLTDAHGQPQIGFSFRAFPTPWTLFFETVGLNKLWSSNPVNSRYRCLEADHASAQRVDQPAGAMLMIRKDVWQRLEGFDEQFFPVWFEDVDFCRRAASAGFHAAYVPHVTAVHQGGHSVLQLPNHQRRLYWYASLIRYSRKYFGRLGRGLVVAGVVTTAAARAGGSVLRLREGSLKEAELTLKIAQSALVYSQQVGAADVRSRLSDEGSPSKENTERTLKRLHAR